jgi:hypothetical protein
MPGPCHTVFAAFARGIAWRLKSLSMLTSAIASLDDRNRGIVAEACLRKAVGASNDVIGRCRGASGLQHSSHHADRPELKRRLESASCFGDAVRRQHEQRCRPKWDRASGAFGCRQDAENRSGRG